MDANATLGTKELFASIGKLITSSLELHEILSGIMEEVRLFFSPENWSLIRYDSTSDSLLFVIVEGINYQSVKDVRLKPGEGIGQGLPGEIRQLIEQARSINVREKAG